MSDIYLVFSDMIGEYLVSTNYFKPIDRYWTTIFCSDEDDTLAYLNRSNKTKTLAELSHNQLVELCKRKMEYHDKNKTDVS